MSALTSREKKNQCWGVAVKSSGHSFHLAAVFDIWQLLWEVWIITRVRNLSLFCSPFAVVRGCFLRRVLWVNQRSCLASSLSFILTAREENNPISSYDPSFDCLCKNLFFSQKLLFCVCVCAKKKICFSKSWLNRKTCSMQHFLCLY